MSTMIREASLTCIHPKAVAAFVGLRDDLARAYEAGKTQSLFKPFESFRDPRRQNELLINKTTKAGAWESAHQYGLAVDFVAWNPNHTIGHGGKTIMAGHWSWEPEEDWDFLAHTANMNGLTVPISWDKCHVEHPLWRRVRQILL